MDLPELLRTVLPYLGPAEQAVYLRLWYLAGDQGTWSVRYDDLCQSAHVSTSSLKRTLKTLTHKKLIKVTFQAKQATRFQVWERTLTPTGKPNLGFTTPKLYDFFTQEDRSPFLSCKRALSPAILQSLDDEAADGDPYQPASSPCVRSSARSPAEIRPSAAMPGHIDPLNLPYPNYV